MHTMSFLFLKDWKKLFKWLTWADALTYFCVHPGRDLFRFEDVT
jgi:hypothetical protein